MSLTFYGSGLYRVCGWDYREGLEPTPPTFALRMARRKRQLGQLVAWMASLRHQRKTEKESTPRGNAGAEVEDEEKGDIEQRKGKAPQNPTFSKLVRMTSSHAEIESLAFDSPEVHSQP